MMRTKTINIYKFSELSEKAKERAKNRFKEHVGYSWSEDALNSLKKAAEHFDCKLHDYSIDWFNSCHSYVSFDCPEMEREEIESRLLELGTFDSETLRGNDDCKLTGFCADEDFINGFRKAFFTGESDLNTLMHAGFDTWLKAAQDDCEGQYSDEDFGETVDANNYEYLENGDRA